MDESLSSRRSHLWETEVSYFEVQTPESIRQNSKLSTQNAFDTGELMIRQEDLILKPDDDAPVAIRDRQFLGREPCYCLLIPSGQELHARTASSTVLHIGTRVHLLVADQALQILPTVIRS